MRVDITECTPEAKPLFKCSCSELLDTLEGISRYGMLRMHAQDRLTNEVIAEIRSRNLSLYSYEDNQTEWEKAVGAEWAIGATDGAERLNDTDYYVCLACELEDEFCVFDINGPLTPEQKELISTEMETLATRVRAERAAAQARWDEEQRKNPQTTTCITGIYIPLRL